MPTPSSAHLRRCAHCHAPAVTRPSPLWRLAVPVAWITVAAMVFGAGLVGPLVMFLIPPLFFGGVSLLSLVHERASAPPQCSACGKIATIARPDGVLPDAARRSGPTSDGGAVDLHRPRAA